MPAVPARKAIQFIARDIVPRKSLKRRVVSDEFLERGGTPWRQKRLLSWNNAGAADLKSCTTSGGFFQALEIDKRCDEVMSLPVPIGF
jgi:hypothetical protein